MEVDSGNNGVNPWIEGGKHVLKETVKYAGYTALALSAVAIPFGGLFAGAGAIGSWLGLGTTATGGMLAAVWPAMQVGAAAGGIVGAVKGAVGASDAIKVAEQDEMFKRQQELAFMQKQQLVGQQMAMAQGGAPMDQRMAMQNAHIAMGGQYQLPNVPYAQQGYGYNTVG